MRTYGTARISFVAAALIRRAENGRKLRPSPWCGTCFTIGMTDAADDPLEHLTEKIIGCAIDVHRELGPGLLESIYKKCLMMELTAARLPFEEEAPVAVIYKGRTLAQRFRLDLVVERTVVVEIKAVDRLHPAHLAQVVSYLKLTGHPAGLLLNFNMPTLRAGMKRLRHPDLHARRIGSRRDRVFFAGG